MQAITSSKYSPDLHPVIVAGALRPPSPELGKIRSRPQLAPHRSAGSKTFQALDRASDREAEASCTSPADYIVHSQLYALSSFEHTED